jgi:hypothetical protein
VTYKLKASTPVNIDRLEYELTNYPDKDVRHYLLNGLRHGFHTGLQELPTQSLECKNLRSALNQPMVVDELLQREVDKGYFIGPFDHPPFDVYRISPLGIAETKYSKKKRLIMDLSAPHDHEQRQSLNSLVDKELFSLKYVRIDDAIAKIRLYGKGSKMCCTDIVDAFKLIGIDPQLWKFYGVRWRDKYYFCVRLSFGSRSSPKIFSVLSDIVAWILTHNYHIDTVFVLLDDYLTVDPPSYMAERTRAVLSLVFNRLQIPLAPHKTEGPCTVLEYLGIVLDSDLMQARLPVNKLVRIASILADVAGKRSVTKRELLSLLGHLNFACRVVVQGRTFMSYLFDLAASVKELHHYVRLRSHAREDLHMWSRYLLAWNGVSFFYDPFITDAHDLEIYTDSAGSIGFGGFNNGRWFRGRWPIDIVLPTEEKLSIAFLELYPILVSAMLWGSEWRGKRIRFRSDNMTTVQIIQKGRSKAKNIMILMRKLTLLSMQYSFVVYSQHVPGVRNEISDALSRFQDGRFRSLAPQASLRPCRCPSWEDVMTS